MPKWILTTRAAILEKVGSPLVVDEIHVPEPEYGQVLVKILYSGVCHSQLMEVEGCRGHDPWVPHLLGHEGVGVVCAVGPGVTKVRPGDEVVLGWIKSEGIDAQCPKYSSGGKIVNAGRVTTFSHHAIVSESRVVKKPDGLPAKHAVLFGCAIPTGAGMVVNEARPTSDMAVAVLGLGGVGLCALMALSAFKPSVLIAIDKSREKLDFAASLGATHLINAVVSDVVEGVRSIVRQGVDLCIEACGSARTIEMGFELVKRGGGKLIFASHPPAGDKISISPFELICGKRIVGSWGGNCLPDRDVPRLYELLRDANAPLGQLICKEYSLDEINVALMDLKEGRVFRPLVKMGHA